MSLPEPDGPEPSKEAKGKSEGGFGWQAFTVALSRFFQKGAYFITSLILARVLGAEGRGLVSALLVPAQLAQNLSEMGIRQSVAFHIGKNIFPLERIVPTLLAMVPIASAISIGLALLYYEFSNIAPGDWLLRALALSTIPLALVGSYCSGVFLGRQRIAAFRKTSWRPALIRLVLIIVLCWFLPMGVYGVMLAGIASGLAGAGYALFLVRRESPLRLGFDREVASKLQRRGFTYAISLFVLLVNYKIMILLLARFSTLTEVGLYTQATTVAELIWEIPTAVSALVLARGVNAKNTRAFSVKVLVLARICFLAAVLTSIAIWVTAPFLFPFLFGPEFAASASLCIALLPGVVAFIVFKILHVDLAGRGRPWAAMIIMVPVLLCNVVLGWWMIENQGALGAAIASSVSYIIAAVLYVFLYAKMTGFTLREIVFYRKSDFLLVLEKAPFLKRFFKSKPAP